MKYWKKPTPEQVDRAVALLVHAEHYRYFFDRLENPEWIKPLWDRGFFRHPPAPIQEEGGTVRFPPWPEARYLARMAQRKPQLVAQIIQEMDDTDNAAVLDDLLDALLAMPPEVGADLADKAERWAERPYWLLPEKMGQLIAHWAKGGRTNEALSVARVLLDVLPDERRAVSGGDEWHRLPPKPRARFDTWDYEEILKKYYPDLVREAGYPALELLCDLLEKTIRLSRDRDDGGREDDLYVWRPAIEDHPQNLGDTIKDALVSAVRDAAKLVVDSRQARLEEVLKALERRRWTVFRRIALHVLRVFPDGAEALAAERLTDWALFEDEGVRHEYVLLLRDRFSSLAPDDQAKILKWIEDGPEMDEWKQWRERETGRQPGEEEIARYKEIWQRDWLARIGHDNLPATWSERYRKLVEKHGEPDHPEFPVYTEGGWVGPTSPKAADELKAMPISEIVEFLRTWEPPKTLFGEPSREGLGRELSSVVADDPERFAAEAPSFQGLDPTYVRHVLAGLREAAKQGKTFAWEPVLELCDWVLSQPREIPGRAIRELDADPGWGWTRKGIADLLLAGLETAENSIPFDLRERVWAILKPLTDDPDPTPEYEQRYGGSNMDPATLSINTTRGKAMHAVIRYALWVRRHLEKAPNAAERLAKGFDEMPEARKVLEAHLDPAREPSLAIRAVYGWLFPWLVLLDSKWARAHAARIFPAEKGEAAFFDAAWNTYVTFCRPYDNVWEILRPQYQHAVERIGAQRAETRWLANLDEKLAEHLMAFYWRGKLSLDDPMFVAFWEKAPAAVRAHALRFVGRSLRGTKGEVPPQILKRLEELWEWRLATAKKAELPSGFEEEMAAFGWWFVSDKFDIDWAIAQLSESLQRSHKSDPDRMVLEQLARTAQSHPRESVECLRMIAEGDREGWKVYANRNHVRNILELALQHQASANEAERVIHYLGSRGFLEFRSLLER